MAGASLAEAAYRYQSMVYRVLSDAVVVIHLAFIGFVAVGGFLVWRWRWLIWVHVPAVVWGVAIIVIGFDCPLTPLENALRERGGEAAYEGGFVNRYIEGVVYPEEYTPYLRALAILLIVVAYARILRAAPRDSWTPERLGDRLTYRNACDESPPPLRRSR